MLLIMGYITVKEITVSAVCMFCICLPSSVGAKDNNKAAPVKGRSCNIPHSPSFKI